MEAVRQFVGEPGGARNGAALAAFLALAAVLYLTLLPFEFRAVPFDEARAVYLQQALALPSGDARQQWVANLLMFLPLGFFWALWLMPAHGRPVARVLVVAGVSLLALAVTAAVEFIQVWMPLREPSLVDMSGNFAGGLLGALVGVFRGRHWWRGVARTLSGEAGLRVRWILAAYVLAYLLASLFPFDFALTPAELADRLAADRWGLWSAGQCSDSTRCVVAGVLKPVLAAPVGVWIASVTAARNHRRWWAAALLAGGFAVGIELLQLLLHSGVAEGRSAVLRAAGMAAGAVLAGRLSLPWVRQACRRCGVPVAGLMALPYGVAVVTILVGLSGFHWDIARAAASLQSVDFLPFLRHYYVSEAVAARSLVSQVIAYAPTGALAWLAVQGVTSRSPGPRHAAWWAAGLAGAFALGVEGLKLFAEGQRPDPTSVLIAAAAAGMTYRFLAILFDGAGSRSGSAEGSPDSGGEAGRLAAIGQDPPGSASASDEPPAPAVPETAESGLASPAWVLRALGAVLWLGVIAAAVIWPIWAPWVVAGLLLYGALLYFRPGAAAFVVPAAVPWLDFSLLTGLEVVDEFDLLVVASIASLLLFARRGRGLPPLPPVMSGLLVLFTLSLAVSSVVGWSEMAGFAQQGVTAYLSEYNILRQIKGFILALCLFLVLPQSGHDTTVLLRRYFVPGMVTGLFLVLAIVAWERAAYPGPFNFENRYRATGLFTDMQVGGPSIETYLVMALPFALLWFRLRRNAARCVVAVILLAGAVHAIWITYSRGGYLGLVAVVCVVAGLGAVVTFRNAPRWRLPLLGGIAAAALTVLSGSTLWLGSLDGFAGQRLGQIEQDLDARLAHWQSALEMKGAGLVSTVFGRGPGSFPHASFLGSPPGQLPANFAFRSEDGGQLVLGVGRSVYLNQRVPLPTGERYELTVRGGSDADALLRVFLCQKHVLHSFECVSRRIRMSGSDAGMETVSVELPTRDLVQPGTFPPRHIAISIRNASREGTITLDSFRLRNAEGEQLLRNADFAAGSLYWYFTTDHYWPWRVENQLLEVYFDQGWFGVITFGLLVGVALLLLGRRAARDDFGYTMILASLSGVLVVGMFSTVFFSPRLAMLFYLVMLLGICAPSRRIRATG